MPDLPHVTRPQRISYVPFDRIDDPRILKMIAMMREVFCTV